MIDFLKRLFSADGFMPHGHCYLWQPGVLWLHIASDALIALAYYSIPFTLVYFIRQRRDIPFNWMFLCFAVFIIACGTTHLMEIWVIWHPTYWLSGCVKAVTALVSVPTAILLIKLLPQAMALPSPAALRAANAELAREIVERQRVEADVRRLNDELERRVAERTRELERANEILAGEIRARQRGEEAQVRLAAIVNSSEDAIIGKTLAGVITDWNPGAEKLFGYTAAEVVGQPATLLFPPDLLQEETEILAQIAAGQSVKHYETVRVCKDGRRVDVAVTVSPILNQDGKIIGASKVAHDITEQKQAAEKTKWLASFPEQNPNPIVELDFAAGIIHYQNPSAARLFPDLQSQGLEHPYLTGLLVVNEAFRIGSRRPVHREVTVAGCCYSQTISCLPENGWFRIYGTDVSELKQAENQLRTSLKEVNDLKAALDEHAIVAITDPQGKITYVNNKFCAISKYSRSELLGQDHRLINSGHHSKEFIQDLWQTIAHGRVWHGEIKNRAKDGSFYWVDTTIVPFLNDAGKPRQYVAIRADVTERKQAGEEIRLLNAELEQRVARRTAELEVANRELEAFSYSVSHDLRAPLRAVNGFAGIVIEEYSAQLPEEGRRYLDRIRSGGQRMGELIDDLLSFSRLSRHALDRHPVDTGRLVREVVQELKPENSNPSVELRLGELPPCQGDFALLKQVWINLVSNALKYSRGRAPAVVEIGCNQNDGEKVFFVRDNGVGFDMQYANKLFGVFQRLHRAEDFEGTGVGLAIVQRIVHRHGGRVWASAKPDQGATFYFTLEEEKI